MKNANWYYEVDLENKVPLQYTQLPEFYGNMGSVNEFTDETLADLSFAVPNRGFLTHDAAVATGYDEAALNEVRDRSSVLVVSVVRQQRDQLLMMSDLAATVDRWNNLDAVAKERITNYRQQLRDITDTDDIANVVWPPLPVELSFIKSSDWPEHVPLSSELKETLDHPVTNVSVEQARADQWTRIMELRDKRVAGGVLVGDKWFHTDTDSLIRYLALLAAGDNIPAGIRWKTMDGSFVDVTPELVRQVYAASVTANNATFQRAETLRTEIDASDTPMSIDIQTGWPPIFGE